MEEDLDQIPRTGAFAAVLLQSTFINRPALGILPPENFVDKLQESLMSVSLGDNPTHVCSPPSSLSVLRDGHGRVKEGLDPQPGRMGGQMVPAAVAVWPHEALSQKEEKKRGQEGGPKGGDKRQLC